MNRTARVDNIEAKILFTWADFCAESLAENKDAQIKKISECKTPSFLRNINSKYEKPGVNEKNE